MFILVSCNIKCCPMHNFDVSLVMRKYIEFLDLTYVQGEKYSLYSNVLGPVKGKEIKFVAIISM